MENYKISEGLTISLEKEVVASDTAEAMGSGVFNFLLSTPAIITLLINTSVKMLDHLLPAGLVTVGKNIELLHLKPTPVGEKITLVITVKKVQGTSVIMDYILKDSTGVSCKGTYERQIVNSEVLLETAYSKTKKI